MMITKNYFPSFKQSIYGNCRLVKKMKAEKGEEDQSVAVRQ